MLLEIPPCARNPQSINNYVIILIFVIVVLKDITTNTPSHRTQFNIACGNRALCAQHNWLICRLCGVGVASCVTSLAYLFLAKKTKISSVCFWQVSSLLLLMHRKINHPFTFDLITMDPCFNLNLSASSNLIIKGLHSVDRLERWVKPPFGPSGPQKYIAKESDGIDNHSILFRLNLSIALRYGLTAQNFKRD